MAVLVAWADLAPLAMSMMLLLHARPHLAIAGPLPKLSPSVSEATLYTISSIRNTFGDSSVALMMRG